MWNKISEADFLRYFGIARESFDGLRLAKMAERVPDQKAESALNFLRSSFAECPVACHRELHLPLFFRKYYF
jgi:hypothetical protein